MHTHLLHGQQIVLRWQSAQYIKPVLWQPTYYLFITSTAETVLQNVCPCQTCAAHQSRDEGKRSKDIAEESMITGLLYDHAYVPLQVGSDAKSDPNYFRCVSAGLYLDVFVTSLVLLT